MAEASILIVEFCTGKDGKVRARVPWQDGWNDIWVEPTKDGGVIVDTEFAYSAPGPRLILTADEAEGLEMALRAMRTGAYLGGCLNSERSGS